MFIKRLSKALEELIVQITCHDNTSVDYPNFKEAPNCVKVSIIGLILAIPFVIKSNPPHPKIYKVVMHIIFTQYPVDFDWIFPSTLQEFDN